MIEEAPTFIVVEGPVGVGKTTLARHLATTYRTELMLERSEDNPFLPRFYEDPKAVALATQLYFLFQRARLIEPLNQGDMFRPALVTDFLLQKDRLFAEAVLERDELALYYQAYDNMMQQAPVPDLVIYLQAPTDTLLERIHGGDVEYVKRISRAYLQRIADAYIEFFYHYQASPLLIVNTADLDLADEHGDYPLLLDCISELRSRRYSGRHYFNPQDL